MKKLVLEIFTAQQKRIENRLLAALESLIERVVKKVVRSTRTIIGATKAVIDNPGSIGPTAALVKLEQRKCTGKVAKIEKHCGQYDKGRMNSIPLLLRTRKRLERNRPPISSMTSKRTSGRTRWQHRTAVATNRNNKTRNWRMLTNTDK